MFFLKPSVCLCHVWYHLQREKPFWPSTASSHDMSPAAGVLQALLCLSGVNFVCEETQQNANLVFSINLQSQIRTFSDPLPLPTLLQNCKQKCGLMLSCYKFWKLSEWKSASNPSHCLGRLLLGQGLIDYFTRKETKFMCKAVRWLHG